MSLTLIPLCFFGLCLSLLVHLSTFLTPIVPSYQDWLMPMHFGWLILSIPIVLDRTSLRLIEEMGKSRLVALILIGLLIYALAGFGLYITHARETLLPLTRFAQMEFSRAPANYTEMPWILRGQTVHLPFFYALLTILYLFKRKLSQQHWRTVLAV